MIWDLDGTIQDSESLAKIATLSAFYDVLGRPPLDEEWSQLLGRAHTPQYRRWFGDEIAMQLVKHLTIHYEEKIAEVHCYANMEDLLKQLHRLGYSMAIATSKLRQHALSELAHKNLLDLFGAVVAQQDTTQHKPDPAPLLLAAERIAAPPHQCVYIGDQPSDILAAKAAGMRSIGTLWGEGQVERLQPEQPDALLSHPDELLELLTQWGAANHGSTSSQSSVSMNASRSTCPSTDIGSK